METEEIVQLIRERLAKIETAQGELMILAKAVENSLYDMLTQNYDDYLKNLSKFYAAYAVFVEKEWLPVVSEIVSTFQQIEEWNGAYFEAVQGARIDAISKKVSERLLETYGLKSNGSFVKGGYVDMLTANKEAGDSLARFLVRESVAKRAKPIALRELGWVVKGTELSSGVIQSTMNSFVFDRMQESDRIVQTVYAEELELTAAFYSGGKIDGTRPFCKARNGKVFLKEEIQKFGTSADTYGGYSDKESGNFAGKPKNSYNPFVSCGGVNCRHSWGYIANRTALRLRNDLKEVNGKLVTA